MLKVIEIIIGYNIVMYALYFTFSLFFTNSVSKMLVYSVLITMSVITIKCGKSSENSKVNMSVKRISFYLLSGVVLSLFFNGLLQLLNLTVVNQSTEPIIIQIILSGFLAPLREELYYRGLLMQSFDYKVVGILVSSTLFGVAHLNIITGICAFIIGTICCLIDRKENSLIPSIALHTAFNITSLLI